MRDNIVKSLLPVNCAYNYMRNTSGNCYSTKCMMNSNDEMGKLISEKGCRVYNMPEVAEILQSHADPDNPYTFNF